MIDFMSDYTMTIDGKAVRAGQALDVINPANGRPFAQCPRASEADLEAAIGAATRAFSVWRRTPIGERRAAMRKAGDLIMANADAIASLFTKEQGRPAHLAKDEILGAGYWFHSTAELDLPVDVTEDTADRRIEVHHVPLGVICGIVPWNFPVLLAAWKIAPALLTGNTIVLKPSPFTPLCTLKIAELLRGVFPDGVLNVISGGDELGPWMTSHKGFAKISFTGSTATGKRVMESAARDLKRITLELGGNDAAIVLPDVDPAKVAGPLFAGAFGNTAQICVATKRLYVHNDIYDDVRDRLVAMAKAAEVGDGSEQGIQFGPIQNKAQFERVKELLQSARDAGLTLHQADPIKSDGYFIPFTIVDNPPEDSRVVREEAFGPILPMMRFTDLDEVIGRANATEYGLAGAVWSGDIARAAEVAARLDTGTVWINQNLQMTPLTPLAGAKQSGFGAENGLYGLKEFTQLKAVYIPKSAASVI
jgi:acyl-CoA reductase-like NAD-dependent aldehyde dehydrogenase